MVYYLAPLEGITTYIYRSAYHQYFAPMDKYFTPFLVPHTKKGFSKKEQNELLPEHNVGMYLVPQIMSNDADAFLHTVRKLENFGYREVNLNLGCPSKTVVSKYRGSGFLARPEELACFLDRIYNGTDVEISIKTRIGKDSPEEFQGLMKLYNKFPVKELIIHPRVQQDFYNNTPNLQVFEEALGESRIPVCYNGDIFTKADHERIRGRFPEVNAMMLGRGIIGNPGLLDEIKGTGTEDKKRLRAFHDKVLEDYRALDFGDKNVLFKMKEIWCYLGSSFPDGAKELKRVKKAERMKDYENAADSLFCMREESVSVM